MPPVQFKSLYDEKQTTGFPAQGKMRYKLFDKCVEFDEIMRQVVVYNSRVKFFFLSIVHTHLTSRVRDKRSFETY